MTSLPHMSFVFHDETDLPVVAIEDDTYDSIDTLVAAVPAVLDDDTMLALVVTRYAHGTEFDLITDPDAFESAYKTRIEGEDPDQAFEQGVVRLRDFGVPNFGDIHVPQRDGDALSWTVADSYTGLPYRGTVVVNALATPKLTPLPLAPAG